MKKAILLHGWGGDSSENWLPWLKDKLEKENIKTFVPNLPNTDNPVIEEQLDYINIYSSDFSDGGNIIGHSLGCQLALKFVEKNNIKENKIILVAPSYSGTTKEVGKDIVGKNFKNLVKYNEVELNFEKINKLNNKITIFLSDNDPYINMQSAEKYYSKLENLEFVKFENKGHFNEKAGVLQLEEILDYLK